MHLSSSIIGLYRVVKRRPEYEVLFKVVSQNYSSRHPGNGDIQNDVLPHSESTITMNNTRLSFRDILYPMTELPRSVYLDHAHDNLHLHRIESQLGQLIRCPPVKLSVKTHPNQSVNAQAKRT